MNKIPETHKIPETQISLEELQDADIGGNLIQTLYADTLTQPKKYMVKNAIGINTEWGVRIDYIVEDEYSEYKVSSWNIITKEKIKALDLIGKNIELIQSKILPKKMELKIL